MLAEQWYIGGIPVIHEDGEYRDCYDCLLARPVDRGPQSWWRRSASLELWPPRFGVALLLATWVIGSVATAVYGLVGVVAWAAPVLLAVIRTVVLMRREA